MKHVGTYSFECRRAVGGNERAETTENFADQLDRMFVEIWSLLNNEIVHY